MLLDALCQKVHEFVHNLQRWVFEEVGLPPSLLKPSRTRLRPRCGVLDAKPLLLTATRTSTLSSVYESCSLQCATGSGSPSHIHKKLYLEIAFLFVVGTGVTARVGCRPAETAGNVDGRM